MAKKKLSKDSKEKITDGIKDFADRKKKAVRKFWLIFALIKLVVIALGIYFLWKFKDVFLP